MRIALLTITLMSVGCSAHHQIVCSIEDDPVSGWTLIDRNMDSRLLDSPADNDSVDALLASFQAAHRLDLFENSSGQLLVCRPPTDFRRCGELAIGVQQTSSGRYVINDGTGGWLVTC